MAHLRTSFIQTCNSSNPLFSNMSGIVGNIGSLFNNQEKQDPKNIENQQDKFNHKNYRSLTLSRYKHCFVSDLQKSVNNMINLNINSLSKIMDKQSNDFKGHDHFFHVLQLQNQNTKQSKLLQSLETLNSYNMQESQLANFQSPNSTRVFTDYVRDNNSQVSQVEQFQI